MVDTQARTLASFTPKFVLTVRGFGYSRSHTERYIFTFSRLFIRRRTIYVYASGRVRRFSFASYLHVSVFFLWVGWGAMGSGKRPLRYHTILLVLTLGVLSACFQRHT